MTNVDLPESYLRSARRRLVALRTLYDQQGYNDVVREAQEIVELAMKAMLRRVGVDPPHRHDVGPELKTWATQFDMDTQTIRQNRICVRWRFLAAVWLSLLDWP